MKISGSIWVILLIAHGLVSQRLYDYQWRFGYDPNREQKFGITQLDFHDGRVTASYVMEAEDFKIGSPSSFTNDVRGHFNMFTTGCHLYDHNAQIISNGVTFHEGNPFNNGCADQGQYAFKYHTLMLPDLIDIEKYYLLTMNIMVNNQINDFYGESLFFMDIQMTNEGTHVSTKEKINPTRFVSGKMQAIPNHTQDKWWLVTFRNRRFEVDFFLVGDGKAEWQHSQNTDVRYTEERFSIGQISFSPDGSKLAMNAKDGVHVYDFDQEKGGLSNFRILPYPKEDYEVWKGLCFSPNSRYVYASSDEKLYQLDTELEDEAIKVAEHWTFDGIGWPVSMGNMFLGPDCRIYVSPGSTTNYLHVINNPDEKGEKCNFLPRVMELPSRFLWDFPNMPQYRNISPCNYDIKLEVGSSVPDHPSITSDKIILYPNPAQNELRIQSTYKYDEVYIYSSMGYVVGRHNYLDEPIDIGHLESGLYFLHLSYKGSKIGGTQKFVKL